MVATLQTGLSSRQPSFPPLSRCVMCGANEARPVLTVEKAPRHHFRPLAAARRDADFGVLAIVRCGRCGHLYNRSFDDRQTEKLYSAKVLTNAPVSPGMTKGLEDIADSILRRAKPRPTVLEVGGGNGDLSLLLSEQATVVHLVEPSEAVPTDRFAGTKVVFHKAMFPAPTLGEQRFDVVVCRQVLEHVPDPLQFLSAIRESLATDGTAYIELPSADYITVNASIIDFHYLHAHYYRRAAVMALFARAGLEVTEVVDVK